MDPRMTTRLSVQLARRTSLRSMFANLKALVPIAPQEPRQLLLELQITSIGVALRGHHLGHTPQRVQRVELIDITLCPQQEIDLLLAERPLDAFHTRDIAQGAEIPAQQLRTEPRARLAL